jgi:hypothetical protein
MPGKLNRKIIGISFITEKYTPQLPGAPGAELSTVGSRTLEPGAKDGKQAPWQLR